jgi:hypothetical protein
LQPLGQPRLDLFGLLPGSAAHREIVGESNVNIHVAGFGQSALPART